MGIYIYIYIYIYIWTFPLIYLWKVRCRLSNGTDCRWGITVLEKCVGIVGSAQQLILSYFSDRTQRVQIDRIMSDFAFFVMWGATGISSGANVIYICFHLVLSLCTIILVTTSTLMTHNSIFQIIKQDLGDLYISVWDTQILLPLKVRDLGVFFIINVPLSTLVVVVRLLIFICITSEGLGTFWLVMLLHNLLMP